MEIEVRLFAVLAERAGAESVEIEIDDGATVRDALEALARKPGMRDPLDKLKIVMAVNREYAHMDVVLHQGDELALIPPVSGGSVGAERLSPAAELLGLRELSADDSSAKASFDASAELTNPGGVVQGGFQMAMLDEVARATVDGELRTLGMKMSFFRPAFPGELNCVAKVEQRDDFNAFVSVSLFDPQQRLLGSATITLGERSGLPLVAGADDLQSRSGEINPDFVELVGKKAGGVVPACARTLGAWPLAAEPGRVRTEFTVGEDFCDASGAVQAGLLAAMMDDTIGPAALTLLEAGHIVPTIELQVAILRQASSGRFICDAETVHRGGSIVFGEARLSGESGELVATAAGTARIVDLRQVEADG